MGTSKNQDRRGTQWLELMHNFSEKHKEVCRASSIDPPVTKSSKKFKTTSRYEGEWGPFGMTGYGEYTFPNGVVYKGEFEQGMFHGTGELVYETDPAEYRAVIRGKWENGIMTSRALHFSDTLEYNEHSKWTYCNQPDRRFDIEYVKGVQPAGKSYMTARQPSIEIPPGYYDTGDGLYNPKTKVIYSYKDLCTIRRAPSLREQRWIVENCRVADVKPLGPRPDLYETYKQPSLLLAQPPPPPATSFTSRRSSHFDIGQHKALRDFYNPTKLRSPSVERVPPRKFRPAN